jgi:hypothetical protein
MFLHCASLCVIPARRVLKQFCHMRHMVLTMSVVKLVYITNNVTSRKALCKQRTRERHATKRGKRTGGNSCVKFRYAFGSEWASLRMFKLLFPKRLKKVEETSAMRQWPHFYSSYEATYNLNWAFLRKLQITDFGVTIGRKSVFSKSKHLWEHVTP